MASIFKKKSFSPTRRIAFSFFAVILIGSFLLSLPISQQSTSTSYLNHLFVATSATCVTGLTPVTISEQYGLFGQFILLILIQVGGLGFLTLLNMMLVTFKHKLSYTNKIVMQEALNQSSMHEIGIYIKRVIKYTFIFEFLGACCLAFIFIPEFGFIKGIYYSIFHSISAFCNAGFDILGSSSLMMYQNHLWMNVVIEFLIIAGGLGFIVWIDLFEAIKKYKNKHYGLQLIKIKKYLSLHTKIVLISTILLLIIGTLLVFVLEYSNPKTIGQLPLHEKLIVSFFQSTTLRTAGFATIDNGGMYVATKLICCMIMFIGGSPAGTAGGIKTVTMAMTLLYIYSLVQGSDLIKIMKRTISDQIVKRSLTIAIVSFFMCMLGLFILTITENKEFIDLVFEVFSAFATVGLTANVTASLTFIGKIVIIILMYIGRIGPMTMVLIFAKRYNQMKGKDIQYPTGDVLIG